MKKIIVFSLSLIAGCISAGDNTTSTVLSAAPTACSEHVAKNPEELMQENERIIILINFFSDICSQLIEHDTPHFATAQAKQEALDDISSVQIKFIEHTNTASAATNATLAQHNSDHTACKQLEQQLLALEEACTLVLSKLATIETLIKNVPVNDVSSIANHHTRELNIMIAQMNTELWKYKFLCEVVQLARDKKYLSLISLTEDDKLAAGFLGMLIATAITESARKKALECMTKLNECCDNSSCTNILCEQLRTQLNEYEIAVNNALREGGNYIRDLINQPENA